jgi:tetratricopeptide (TPR) repeat protein
MDRLAEELPFDELVIKGDERVFRLVPIEMAKRTPLARGAEDEELIMRLLDRPEQKYAVKWGDIERITLWEEKSLQAAAEQVGAGRFAEAYASFLRVQGSSPGFPGLEKARQDCLLAEGRQRLAAGQPEAALVPLRELCQRNRDYPELSAMMGSVVDQLVERDFAAGRDAAARELVELLANDFPEHTVVVARRQQLMARARDRLAIVVAAMSAERWRDAHDALEQTLAVWPALAEAQPVAAELSAKYPLFRVGVRDRAPRDATVPGAMTWECQRLRTLIPIEVTTNCQHPPWPVGLSWPANLDAPTDTQAREVRPYVSMGASSEQEPRFVLVDQETLSVPGPPREITERCYENVADAIRDFAARRLAVLDRVAPWELDLVRARPDLILMPYATPTVHLLIPNPRSPHMVSGSARRAVSLGIARERIMQEDLGCASTPVVTLLPGVFPRGVVNDDELETPRYDPRLAIALSRAEPSQNSEGVARLVLISDRSLLTRRAAQAIQQQLKWDGLGYEVEVLEPSAASIPVASGDWDLALIEWVGMDPPQDIWKLAGFLAETGALNGELGEALRQLGQASSAAEVERALARIERGLLEQSLVIPLWQFSEHAAVHKSLHGVGERPVSLYEHVAEWTRSDMP